MLIKCLVSMGDALGRSFRPGAQYNVEDEEAERLIGAGYAIRVVPDHEQTVELLKAQNAGLAVTEATAPLSKRRPATAKSSVSILWNPVVMARAWTSRTGPARQSSRSSVWIAWLMRTPPPSRAHVPRPGSS